MCVDIASEEVVQTILFPTDVALPVRYFSDLLLTLRGARGTAFITHSSDQGARTGHRRDFASGERAGAGRTGT